MQATVFSYDPATHGGQVVLDDGKLLDFGADAFEVSGLRLLRPGQRVRIEVGDDGVVLTVTILTMPQPL
jgi:hypothetical protein